LKRVRRPAAPESLDALESGTWRPLNTFVTFGDNTVADGRSPATAYVGDCSRDRATLKPQLVDTPLQVVNAAGLPGAPLLLEAGRCRSTSSLS
jgi:hypothetical protein